MCGGCAPATGINSPPEGGVHGPPARFACAVPAAPRALPGRGLAPPDPQGCAPWRAFAHRAPAASVTQPEGFRARVRRWRGWATACGCPCPTPSPWRFSGFWEVSKSWAAQSAAGGSGGVPPVSVERWATRKWPVGGQGAAARLCPPSTDWARLSTGDRVQGGAVVQNNLIGQTFLVLHNQPAQSRASIGFQENHCIKK